MKKIIICVICFVFSFSVMAQRKYYVKPDGSPTYTGTSWRWASDDLTATIEKAVAGDIIYVAVGTYQGGFLMKEGVTVKGGYTANTENPEERYLLPETTDPAKQSILDGGNNQRVLTQYAPFSVATTWEGFVIQNGSPSVEFDKGSVIYSSDGSGKIVGVLYKYDSESGEGMMIGREELKKQWGGYSLEFAGLPIIADKESAKNDLSGISNSEKIVNVFGNKSVDFSQEDYPSNGNYAAYWCDTLTTGGYSNWYLPSSGELQEVYDAGVAPVMKSIGKNTNNAYWTSSHAGDALAWAYYFDNGYFHPALKYIKYLVNAIHPFVKPAQPDGIYFAGGGVFLSNNGILENCVVKDNVSPSKGGGVYVGGGGALVNCTVEGNNAPEGKEIYYEWPVSIDEILQTNNSIKVYPNPVKKDESINIDLSQGLEFSYQLANSAGLVIDRGNVKAGNESINAPSEKGIYIFILQSKDQNYKSKIIVY